MIVLDSSALLAIIFDEPERQSFEDLIARDEQCLLWAVDGHETACVLRARHGPIGVRQRRIVAATDVIACSPS